MASLMSYSNLKIFGCYTPEKSILNSTPVVHKPPTRSIFFGDVSSIHENSAIMIEDGNESYLQNVTSFASCPDLQLRPFRNCMMIRKKQFGYRCCKTKQTIIAPSALSCSKLQARRPESDHVRFNAVTVKDSPLKRYKTTVGLPPIPPRQSTQSSRKLGLLRMSSVKFNKLRRKYSGKLDILGRTYSSKLDIDTDEQCNLRRFKSLSAVTIQKSPGKANSRTSTGKFPLKQPRLTYYKDLETIVIPKSPRTPKYRTSTDCVNSKLPPKQPRFNHCGIRTCAIRTCPIRKSLRITRSLDFSTSVNKSFVLTNGLLLTSATTLKRELKSGQRRTCC